ncbi:EAL domain-containing protein [Thiocystis violascens]|uniref:EAL domain-containing protein n=1 Tax=Thiocystis violascens (strain ATCC 17096 / DSM 198 / 6111) TaxID=765911 RepID=I3Y803_THIV6|nr:EAL domain-containing protein [Thiocystis violascens]AFL73121.1 EAL domain-containing protein [Thiocystis violascens DSM 198]
MMKTWFLKGAPVDGNTLLVPMRTFPVTVGRSTQCTLSIDSTGVSRVHASLDLNEKGELFVTDLGSTNGTYLNRQRIMAPTPAAEGDILHFGTAEFRVDRQVDSALLSKGTVTDQTCLFAVDSSLPENFLLLEPQFMEMLLSGQLRVAWQPIVDFQTLDVLAYEVLGRGAHLALPQSPYHLFLLAEKLRKEVELSHAFRVRGAQAASQRGGTVRLFMNSHPREMFMDSFLPSIDRIRAIAPRMELVMEIHETAVNEGNAMKTVADHLRARGVLMAYDDFGAGQARLREMAEIPADIVKFDMGLIRDIHLAPPKKQQMLAQLVKIVSDLGSQTLAEGVETQEEAEVCRQMGFQLCQGYLTGRPEIVL